MLKSQCYEVLLYSISYNGVKLCPGSSVWLEMMYCKNWIIYSIKWNSKKNGVDMVMEYGYVMST